MEPATAALIRLRRTRPEDGAAIWSLREAVGTLDPNSAYLYLLLADRFRDTCAVAEDASGGLVAFLTGFVPPRQPDTYFVWQIGVHTCARGLGLAGRLLDHVVDRLPAVRFLEATVSPSNTASSALFRAFARRREAKLVVSAGYPADRFPAVEPPHEAEPLYRIGPFEPSPTSSPTENTSTS